MGNQRIILGVSFAFVIAAAAVSWTTRGRLDALDASLNGVRLVDVPTS
jgi:hypothetical protein